MRILNYFVFRSRVRDLMRRGYSEEAATNIMHAIDAEVRSEFEENLERLGERIDQEEKVKP